jgi:hypothetical protein
MAQFTQPWFAQLRPDFDAQDSKRPAPALRAPSRTAVLSPLFVILRLSAAVFLLSDANQIADALLQLLAGILQPAQSFSYSPVFLRPPSFSHLSSASPTPADTLFAPLDDVALERPIRLASATTAPL